MQDFKNLRVWQDAHAFALHLYTASRVFPPEERFGLTSQLRRAAVSIPSNIAEGSGRSDADFARFLHIALGSASEAEYQLLLARDLGYLSDAACGPLQEELQQVRRELSGFIKKLRA